MSYPKPAKIVKARKPITRTSRPKRGKFTARKSPFQAPEWKKLRLLCKRNATGVCQDCGNRPGTQAHHTRYHGGRGLTRILVPPDWLLWLCEACHQARHPMGEKQVKQRTTDGGYTYFHGRAA